MPPHPNRKKKSVTKTSTVASAAQAPAPVLTTDHEHDYAELLTGMRSSFLTMAHHHRYLFKTDIEKGTLYDLYLNTLPAERQHHNCSACRNFINRFGGLVAISEHGRTIPVMWNPEIATPFYAKAINALHKHVAQASVTGVFFSKEVIWGTPVTGPWTHFAVQPPDGFVYRDKERALTPGQAMAAKKENFLTVINALKEIKPAVLDEGLRVFQTGSVDRAEKFVGPLKWLRALHNRPKGKLGTNILWRAIAAAPEGYCHPRTSVVAPLLEGIEQGLPFETLKKRFNAMVESTKYQRPTAAPTSGSIKAAEEIVAKLGLAPSLERRFARLSDLQEVLWYPSQVGNLEEAKGVFGHLVTKDRTPVPSLDLPTIDMTWVKFEKQVLPDAKKLQLYAPSHGAYIGVTTAVHPDAPPILKWDRPEARNPVAWYIYNHGSPASRWGIKAGWTDLTAISTFPTQWGDRPIPYIGGGEGVILVIEGAADREVQANMLFPECIRDDLHSVRSVVEAYSKTAKMQGLLEASACGYDLRKNSCNALLRVWSGTAWTSYKIDRWD